MLLYKKGEDGESTTTTPTKVDPDTGDVVERGEPTTEVTKMQLTRLYTLHLKKYHKAIKMYSIQKHLKISVEEIPGKPGVKIQIQKKR